VLAKYSCTETISRHNLHKANMDWIQDGLDKTSFQFIEAAHETYPKDRPQLE